MSIEHGSSFKLSGSSCVRLSVRRVIRCVVGLPRRRRLAGSWSVTAFQTSDQQAEISGPYTPCAVTSTVTPLRCISLFRKKKREGKVGSEDKKRWGQREYAL